MLRLAWPVLLEQLLNMLVGFSDTLLTGWYFDAPHLAAMNLMAYLMWLIGNVFIVVNIGGAALVARFVGAGKVGLARRTLNQALLLGAALAIPALLMAALFGRPLIEILGLEGDAAKLAHIYLAIIIPAIPIMMFESVGNACLRGAGDTLTGLLAMGLVNVVNIGLSWSLARGWGPIPALGWPGLAIGTATGYVCGGLFVLARLLRGRAGLCVRLRLLRPNWDLCRRLLRIGIFGGADILSVILCQLWFVGIVNDLGVLAAAAHGVAIRLESIAYLPGTAFQVAASTMSGQFLGAGDARRASHSVWLACFFGLVLMSIAGLILYAAAGPLTMLFLSAEQVAVARETVPLLRIVSFSMPALAVLMVLSGALRGAGDTRWPLLITLTGFLIVRIPMAYWLTGSAMGWGVQGAWYAMVADLVVRSILVVGRFWQGGWKRGRV